MSGGKAEQFVRRAIRPVLWAVVTLPAVYLIAATFLDKLGANPIRELEYQTGRWTIRLLAGSLAVTPLMRITGWGWLIAQRRFLGVAAFVWAMLHFSMYVAVDMFFDINDIVEDIVKHKWVTFGMITIVLLVPLALTSTKASIRRLGAARWKRLHSLVYVAAVTATIHYLWAVKKDTFVPILYFGVFAALLGFRLIWRRQRSAGRSDAAPTPQ